MWHCVISWGVIAERICFKYYNLWYTVRFGWCYEWWGNITKFNVFHFLTVSAVCVSDNISPPYGDSRWGRGKWLEVTVAPSHYLMLIHWVECTMEKNFCELRIKIHKTVLKKAFSKMLFLQMAVIYFAPKKSSQNPNISSYCWHITYKSYLFYSNKRSPRI